MKYLMMLCIAFQLYGHGVGYDLKPSDEVQLLSFYYADGRPMSYCSIYVYSPTDGDVEYQNGRTDRGGYFAFYPTSPGLWLVTAKDAKGHSASARVLMKKEGSLLKGSILQ